MSNFREALQTATDKKGSRAIKVVFDAALLPASSVPNVHTGSRTRLPAFIGGGDIHTPLPTEADLPDLTPASQDAPLTGPSHFTMAQSEDFSADFDNTHFMAPKPRRPPSPLQFPRTTEDIPDGTSQSSLTNATNVEPPALEKAEELAENPAPQE